MTINCTETVPYARELLSNLTAVGLGLIISAGIATLFTVIFSAIACWFIYKNTRDVQERYICWLLVGICPVVGVTSYVGLLSPRSSEVNILISAIYVSLSVALFFRLIMLYMGGEGALCKNLEGAKLPLSRPPFCCLVCLRNVHLKRQTLRRVKLLVYQSILFRPILLYIDAVMKMEAKTSSPSLIKHPAKLVVTILTMASTLLSFLGLVATFRLSVKPLRNHGIVLKFLHMKLVLLFCDPQGALLAFIVTTGALPCSHIFYHPEKAATLKFILLCYEMLLLSILGLKQYRRKIPDDLDAELKVQPKEDNGNGYNSLSTAVKDNIDNQGHTFSKA